MLMRRLLQLSPAVVTLSAKRGEELARGEKGIRPCKAHKAKNVKGVPSMVFAKNRTFLLCVGSSCFSCCTGRLHVVKLNENRCGYGGRPSRWDEH